MMMSQLSAGSGYLPVFKNNLSSGMGASQPSVLFPSVVDQFSVKPLLPEKAMPLERQAVEPVQQTLLLNGTTGYLTQMPFAKRSTIDIVLPVANLPLGTDNLLLSVLSSGSKKTKQIIQHLEDQGMALSLHTIGDKLFVRGRSPIGLENELLDQTLSLLLQPVVDAQTYQALQNKTIETIQSKSNDPDQMLLTELHKKVYGAGQRYSLTPQEAVLLTRQESLLQLVGSYLNSTQAFPGIGILMVSPLPAQKQKAILNTAIQNHGWVSRAFPSVVLPPLLPSPSGKQPTVLLANNNLKSALVKSMWSVPDIKSSDYPAFFLLSAILEGTSAGSFFDTLRTRDGLVYSISSDIGAPLQKGNIYHAGVIVPFDKIHNAIQDIEEVTRQLCSRPVSDQELSRLKRAFLLDVRDTKQDSLSVSSSYLSWLKHQLRPEDLDVFQARVNAVSAQDILRVANKVFNTQNGAFNMIGVSAPGDVLEKTFLPGFQQGKAPS